MKIMVNELLGKCNCNYKSDDFRNVPKSDTFFFCTIKEAKYLRNQMLGIVAYDDKCFNVSEWLPFIGSNALNWKDSYYVHSSQLSDREIGKFCRSNSGDKIWSGQLIKDGSDITLVQSQVMSDELMFIAPKVDIAAEWRIWMKDGDCVASSSYHNDFCEYSGGGGNEGDAVDFAVRLAANEFEPDEWYVVDVAYTLDGYKVVEYNAYSTSGFYEVDVDKLIKATSAGFDKEV